MTASKESPRDAQPERTSIEGEIEMIRSDPSLSEDEKSAAIEELRKKRDGSRNPPGHVG